MPKKRGDSFAVFLGDRLLWCYNEAYYPHRYTHVLMRGDSVISYHKSRALADAALEDARAKAWNEGHRLRILYERRRKSTDLNPDHGNLVRLPSADRLYPTQQSLRDAVFAQWALYKSYHVEELTINN